MKKIACILLAVMVMLPVLVACNEQTPVLNDAEEFRIVTSFYPVYAITLNIVGGAENVTLLNLTEPDTGCLHDYTLTTEDLKKVSGSDLFIASGMGMESFVGKNSFGVPRLEVLDCGEDIMHTLGEEGEENPHYWMNVENAIEQCDKIKRTLCRLDPSNSNVYEANAEEYIAKLRTLLSEAQERTSKLEKREMVVFDNSFDYFAEEFGINTVQLIAEGHDSSSPSAGELAEAVEYIKKNNIEYIFVQKSFMSNAAYRTIANETGCTPIVIDSFISGEINSETKDAYINVIRKNLAALEQGLS